MMSGDVFNDAFRKVLNDFVGVESGMSSGILNSKIAPPLGSVTVSKSEAESLAVDRLSLVAQQVQQNLLEEYRRKAWLIDLRVKAFWIAVGSISTFAVIGFLKYWKHDRK